MAMVAWVQSGPKTLMLVTAEVEVVAAEEAEAVEEEAAEEEAAEEVVVAEEVATPTSVVRSPSFQTISFESGSSSRSIAQAGLRAVQS